MPVVATGFSTMALTVKKVAKLTERGRYLDGHGLYLQVTGPNSRSWLFRYVLNGKERWLGLGSASVFSLDEARSRAQERRKLLADGIDPLEQKHAERRAKGLQRVKDEALAKTFEQAARDYFAAHEKRWKNQKHRDQFLSSLRIHAFPTIGRLPVGAIDKELVLKVIQPIWPTIPETANRVRGRIETVLNYAGAMGWRDATTLNPARWRGFLDTLFMPKTRVKPRTKFKALDWRQMPNFMASLRARQGVSARALEFTILTAARTSEVTGAQWDEIDLDAGIWTVPAARMKKGREHRVPLTSDAVTLLRKLPREDGNGFVFIGPRNDGLSNMAMDAILRRMNLKDRATVHGMRSAFRDWAAETTSFPKAIIELSLAHMNKDKIEDAYLRTDLILKRRKLMEKWSAFCARPVALVENIQQARSVN